MTPFSAASPSAKIAEREKRDGRKIKQRKRDSIRSLMELVYETLAATCGRWTELRLAMTWPGFPWASLSLSLSLSLHPSRQPSVCLFLLPNFGHLSKIPQKSHTMLEIQGGLNLARCTTQLNSAAQAREIGQLRRSDPGIRARRFFPGIFWSEQLDTRRDTSTVVDPRQKWNENGKGEREIKLIFG